MVRPTPIHPARQMPYKDLFEGLSKHADLKLVRKQTCPYTNLSIWTYTKQTIYQQAWNPITNIARGLILNERDGEVVATPFPKFWESDWELASAAALDLEYEAYEKKDGSLIILFHHEGQWRAASKGSFTSPQARWATKKLTSYDTWNLLPGTTYLAEAIYPANRIVVPYGAADDLYLLGAYDKEGKEYPYSTLQAVANLTRMKIVDLYIPADKWEPLHRRAQLPSTVEGWVIRFPDGHRIKVKGEEYLKVHRAVTNLTPLVVWQSMRGYEKDGTPTIPLTDLKALLPSEFHSDFDQIIHILQGQLDYLLEHIKIASLEASEWSDKELGLRLESVPREVRDFIFPMRRLNGKLMEHKKMRHKLFEAIRPTGNHLLGFQPSDGFFAIQQDLP